VNRFAARNVIVTGGSSGIGRAIVREFADEGAFVLAIGRDRERLAAVEADRVATLAVDLRDTGAVLTGLDRHLADHGRIDVLVNCAGVAIGETIPEITSASWDETIATNLGAVFFVSQWAARQMVAAGGGAIVNVASIDAFTAESPSAHYCTSKAGVVMLTQCFAYEFGHLGVRANAVAPGFTATPMTMGSGDDASRRFFDDYMKRIPLRRPSLPREQARVVLFLASDDASYINGETVVVDGGQLKGFWSTTPGEITTAAYDDVAADAVEGSRG
jgi:NAD(P)-dependent dehydrogenase (short-subunit alcohol dehydrogenase family)